MSQTNYELLDFSSHMPLRCVMRQLGYRPMHQHDYFEIDFVLSGKLSAIIDEQVYAFGPEDLFTVDPHVPHELRSPGCVLISVQFEQSLFENTLPTPQHPHFFCNSAVQGDSAAFAQLRRLIARLVKNNADQQTGYELRNLSLIYEIMDVFYNNFRILRTKAQDQQNHRYAFRIAEIARIVRAHYTESFSLSMLAEKVHLSAPYLSKFFDQQFGMTFLAYLTQIRLDHAVNLLGATEKTIDDIALDSGFANAHAFVQAFKKEYDVLPSVYRRRLRAEKEKPTPKIEVEQHDYMAGLKKYLQEDGASAPVQKLAISSNVRLNAERTAAALSHTWRNVLSAGNAADLLLADVQEMVRRMQTEIGFRYIKLHNVFSDVLHVYSLRSDGTPTFHFFYLDRVLDFVTSLGLRPMIELSFMPAALAKNPNRQLFHYLVSEPNQLSRWTQLVSALMQHLKERCGVEALRSWRFSVWREPDTPEALFGFSSDEKYFRFYQATRAEVKACDAQIPFGAPATFYLADVRTPMWYLHFLDWCRKNDCLPEYLNFVFYDVARSQEERGGQTQFGFVEAMVLRGDGEGMKLFLDQALAERKELGLQELPIYLTEWNHTPSQQDLLNDTCFRSCYLTKNILQNYDRIDSFGVWSVTDLMAETNLPRELFFGGLGLFTQNGIPKAGYYALTLLSRLGDQLIGKGEGWFATRQGGEYRIILYNYRHFSHLYSIGERFDMTFTERYTPFTPEQSLDVHLRLDNVPNGTYCVTETTVNRKSGSAFDQWLEMGALEPDGKQELETLTALSHPHCSKYLLTAENHTLSLDAMLELLEVRLFIIRPDAR